MENRHKAWADSVIQAALGDSTRVVGAPLALPSPLYPGCLGDVFGAVNNVAEIEALVMSALCFADLRVFGRDQLDMETHKERLQAGWVACLWGTPIIVGGPKRGSSIWVVGCDAEGYIKQEALQKEVE